MKKLLGSMAVAAATCMPVFASVTINFTAGDLRDFDGSNLVSSGALVVIGVSTLDGSFATPSPTGFFSGDDVEIYRGNVSPDGQFTGSLSGVNYSSIANWTAGDPLAIYWYPTLTTASTAPEVGVSYGTFRTDSVQSGSEIAWISPSDGTTSALSFVTASLGGDNPDALGYASNLVVPEPSTYAGAFGALCLAGATWFRRRKAAHS